MSYSACDFYDDVMAQFARSELIASESLQDEEDIQEAAGLVCGALYTVVVERDALRAALRRLRGCPDVQMDCTEPETDAAREQADRALGEGIWPLGIYQYTTRAGLTRWIAAPDSKAADAAAKRKRWRSDGGLIYAPSYITSHASVDAHGDYDYKMFGCDLVVRRPK